MFLTARKMAFAGIILAVSLILLMLGSVLEMSTLFLLAAAAMCIGIIIRELGCKAGAVFLAASVMLGFFLAPNKIYVLTYGAMEVYILLRELIWEKCFAGQEKRGVNNDMREASGQTGEQGEFGIPGAPMADAASKRLHRKYMFIKWLVYQPLFLPFLFLAPRFFTQSGEISPFPMFFLLFFGGEILWLVCDAAYDIFQSRIWSRVRRQFGWMR